MTNFARTGRDLSHLRISRPKDVHEANMRDREACSPAVNSVMLWRRAEDSDFVSLPFACCENWLLHTGLLASGPGGSFFTVCPQVRTFLGLLSDLLDKEEGFLRLVQKELSLCSQKYFLTTVAKQDQWPNIVILLLRRLRQEDGKCEASLSYIARPCLKNKEKNKPQTIHKWDRW